MYDALGSVSAPCGQLSLPFEAVCDLPSIEPPPAPALPVLIDAPFALMRLARDVAAENRITVREMFMRCNARRVSWPRQEWMWRARMLRRPNGDQRYSLPQLARFVDRMRGPDAKRTDHTTIMYGADRYAGRRRKALIARARADNELMARVHGRAA